MSKNKKSDITLTKVPMAEIKPYGRNPRHNDAAVDGVLQSIQNYGFCVPILLDKNKTIIAGHTRYKALQKLGWSEAPCIIRADLSEDKVRELRIVDNKTAEQSTWNWDHLMPELREMTSLEDMQVFFPDMDLGVFLSDEGGVSPPQDQTDSTEESSGGATSEKSAAAQEAYVEMTCPECGKGFTVDKIEFDRRLARNKKDGDGDGAETR